MLDIRDALTLSISAVGGILLGAFYFCGLWWTIRRISSAGRPLSWYFGSLLIRMAVVVAVFFAVLVNYDWPPLVACLAGFVAVRMVLVRRIGDVACDAFPVERPLT